MSEQNAEQSSGEPGSLSSGPTVPNSSDAQSQLVSASTDSPGAVSPDPAPGQGAAELDATRAEATKADAPKTEAPRTPGKVLIMSAGDRDWRRDSAAPATESEPGQGMFGKRRLAVAAMVTLAVVAGALGGALATAGLSHLAGGDVAGAEARTLEVSIARIDADILALKAGLEHTSKMGMVQFNKTTDRLDKVEKAQADPAAKLAKLSETVEKLRAVPPPAAPAPVAAATAAPKEVTGSIAQPAAAAAPATESKPEVGRLPTVEGWVLRDVAYGGALISGRRGMYEVYAGDLIPGVGRVDAIRRQDGRWVVVTSKGLIVAR